MLYEARRRIGEELVVVDARAGGNGAVWIRPDGIDNVVDIVARDLVRGHRTRVTSGKFAEAYDALVAELRRELPTLAGFGLAHERPRETQRLRARLVKRVLQHSSTHQ